LKVALNTITKTILLPFNSKKNMHGVIISMNHVVCGMSS